MKYYGIIGFEIQEEELFHNEETDEYLHTGNWVSKIIEKPYSGDVLRNTSKRGSTDKLNDDINVSNRISVLADPFAYHNFASIVYVTWMGKKWKVPDVEVQYPRLILDVGGVYNEQTPNLA